MKMIKRRISMVAAFTAAILIAIAVNVNMSYADTKEYVTVSVERFTIGQGYLIEPTNVELKADDTVATVLARLLEQKGYEYTNYGSIESGFYISTIKNADNGKVNIPQCIENTSPMDMWGTIVSPSTNSDNIGNASYPALGEMSYSYQAGFMVSVNNVFPSVGMSDQEVYPSDVIRLQFSIFGYGADVGNVYSQAPDYELANKDNLSRAIAKINADKSVIDGSMEMKKAYNDAVNILIKLDSSQTEVDKVYDELVSSSQKKDIPLTSIKLSVESVDMYIGDTKEILVKAYIPADTTDEKRVTWSSSDSTVASVTSDGIVTAKKSGSVYIKAVTPKGIAASCLVTVTKKQKVCDVSSMINNTVKYLSVSNKNPGMEFQWEMLGMSRSSIVLENNYKEKFIKNATDALEQNDGVLTTTKYTEYSKLILAITSVGVDVRKTGEYNLLSYISDFDLVKKQGINGPVWALIAINSNKNYSIPKVTDSKANQCTSQKLIDYILEHQLGDGGFSLSGSKADADMTSMAVIALSSYYGKDKIVTKAVNRAVSALSNMQDDKSGGYKSYGVENSESTAMVVLALTSIGRNPSTDTLFVKNNKSVMDALLSFYVKDGGFSHLADGKINAMATSQGLCALTAYDRLIKGKSFIYNMNDIALKEIVAQHSQDSSDEQVQESTKKPTKVPVNTPADTPEKVPAKVPDKTPENNSTNAPILNLDNDIIPTVQPTKEPEQESKPTESADIKSETTQPDKTDDSWEFEGDKYVPVQNSDDDTHSNFSDNKKSPIIWVVVIISAVVIILGVVLWLVVKKKRK